MAYEDFLEMYAADTKTTPAALLAITPKPFPVSTNIRGEALVEKLSRAVDLDFSGKRVLDVGCAYGGLSIALAHAGAHVSGIDVSQRFLEYAEANSAGVAKIGFHLVDASSKEVRALFKQGEFDFVIINDVLEHVYDTAGLLSNLDWLVGPKGLIYFKYPNGLSPRFILSEGHRKIFGLALLDPDCWFHLYPKRASIFYRTTEHYESIFANFGFGNFVYLDEEKVFDRFNMAKFQQQIQEVVVKARDYKYPNNDVKNYIHDRVDRFQKEFDFDRKTYGEEYLKFRYGSYFFTGLAARPDAGLSFRSKPRDLPRIGGVQTQIAAASEKATPASKSDPN